MDKVTIKDLMVPLDEYATVSEDATLFDAVLALEKAQNLFDRKRSLYLHRAILVFDNNENIVGKISQLDVLRALDPKYGRMGESRSLSKAGFSPSFLRSMLEQYTLLAEPFDELCGKAAKVKVKEFMYTPSEGEYLDENASMREAVHRFVMGHHQSLLVTRAEKIIGILRLTDVFKEVFQRMKACSL